MNSRQRIRAAIDYGGPDKVPVMYAAMAAGLYQHGQRLLDLWRKYPQDYGPYRDIDIPAPRTEDYDESGRYYSTSVDHWGVTWEYRIFGIMGHPLKRPLDDLSQLDNYKPPAPPQVTGPGFDMARERVKAHKENYYFLGNAGGLFEVLIGIRKFEDVLIDIYDNTPEINRIADMITEYQRGLVDYALALGADGIAFGDDFGTENSLMLSLDVWRRFFKPRYESLMEPIRNAGVDIQFHTCGHTIDLLDDLADLGVKVLWPQLTANDNEVLARRLREHHMTLLAHIDRRGIMPYGTPEEVRDEVLRIRRTFGTDKGGLIFYGEVDHDFPFDNVEALYRAFHNYSPYSADI